MSHAEPGPHGPGDDGRQRGTAPADAPGAPPSRSDQPAAQPAAGTNTPPDQADETTPGPAGNTTPDKNAAESGEPNGTEPKSPDPALGDTVAALTSDDIEPAQRKTYLARLVQQVRVRGVGDLFKPTAALRWISDALSDVVPYIPIRDLETLKRHHDGLEGDALAERLVRIASIATASVGAAGGGVAAVQWAATPTLLSAPVLLAAETVAVVAIEIKLIGELHEVYGQPVTGSGAQRGVTLVTAWSQQRGVNPLVPGVGIGAVLGTAARKELRDRLLRRFGRNLTTLGPFLTGAAVASYLNRRATKLLGDRVRDDLRRQHGKIIDGTAS